MKKDFCGGGYVIEIVFLPHKTERDTVSVSRSFFEVVNDSFDCIPVIYYPSKLRIPC